MVSIGLGVLSRLTAGQMEDAAPCQVYFNPFRFFPVALNITLYPFFPSVKYTKTCLLQGNTFPTAVSHMYVFHTGAGGNRRVLGACRTFCCSRRGPSCQLHQLPPPSTRIAPHPLRFAHPAHQGRAPPHWGTAASDGTGNISSLFTLQSTKPHVNGTALTPRSCHRNRAGADRDLMPFITQVSC